jgi:uncharacterized membrane protein/protein-disulfide isomerase
MTTRILAVLVRVALLVALAASTALHLDYTSPAPSFCGDGGGCAAVKASAWSHVGGIALPTIGVAAFAAVLTASLLVNGARQWRMLAVALGLGGGLAALLVATQVFMVRAICPYCMVVDASAMTAAVAAGLLVRREPEPEPWPLRFGWLLAGAVAVGAPMSWSGVPVATVELPAPLASLQTEGTDIVMFTDFQCPFCRKLHHALHARLAKEAPGRVRLRRFMAPLPFHKAAEPAARAYVCATDATREAMADALYDADFAAILGDVERAATVSETLLREELVRLAEKAGLDGSTFKTCLDAESTRKTVEDEFALYKSLALPGLPTTYVDDKRIVGADVKALEQALGGSDSRTMFGLLAVVFFAAAAASLSRPRDDAAVSGEPSAEVVADDASNDAA